jgi:hypothetical protein
MGRSVIITTPIPSVEEVARSVGVSQARLRRIREIIDGTYPPKTSKGMASGLDGRHRDADGKITEKRGNRKTVSLNTKKRAKAGISS